MYNKDDIQVGVNLRNIRHTKKTEDGKRMSQTALGDILGITYQQVQKYESGANKVSPSRLYAICDALGCQPMDVLDYKGGSDDHHAYVTACFKELNGLRNLLLKIKDGIVDLEK